MSRKITRRQFLKRSAAAAAAVAAAPSMRWIPGTNVSYAAGPGDAILVYFFLDGGNDGLNTVYPLSGTQRALYDEYRPTLGHPDTVAGLSKWNTGDSGLNLTDILSIGNDAAGDEYALHPVMTGLHDLYQQGKMAVVHGVHYAHPNHSHFRSTEIWETGDPVNALGAGWFARYLDYAGFGPTDVPGVILNSSVQPLFTPTNTSLFTFRRLSDLQFPASDQSDLKQDTFRAMYDESDDRDALAYPELVKLAQTGIATVDKMQEYYKPGSGSDDAHAGKVEKLLLNGDGSYNSRNDLVYDSPLNSGNNPLLNQFRLARDLRHVAATIRADVGARFFHVRLGGFDTHSSQEQGLFHSALMLAISEGMAALYNDLAGGASLPGGYTGYRTGPLADKVLLATFSEFGRTIRQNASSANSAGTDHAAASVHWVVGGQVVGGQYGVHPQLDDPRPNNHDDLKMTHDLRDFYGTIVARWLNVPLSELGPGPGKIMPATVEVDSDGNDYTAFTPIPFLA